MQTFLPYEDYEESARVLDDKRLGKQRSESIIILKTLLGIYRADKRKGWPHHPATKMWAGHELALCDYSIEIANEWIRRGHKDTTLEWFEDCRTDILAGCFIFNRPVRSPPPWIGDEQVHESHRSNLLRKEPEHYRKFWPELRDDLPYVWPVE
jgi:hypothetical protein